MQANLYNSQHVSQKELLTQLSSKFLFLQTMFRSVDLVHYHQNRQLLVKNAFLTMKAHALQQSLNELQEESYREDESSAFVRS